MSDDNKERERLIRDEVVALRGMCGGFNDDLIVRLYNEKHKDTIGVQTASDSYQVLIYKDGCYSSTEAIKIIDERIGEIAQDMWFLAIRVDHENIDKKGERSNEDYRYTSGIAEAMMAWASSKRNEYGHAAIVKRIAKTNLVDAGCLDGSKTAVVLKNGTILYDREAKTWRFEPTWYHDVRNTMKAGVEYKAGSECPRWVEFVSEALSYEITGAKRTDTEAIAAEVRLLRAMAGYSLMSGNPEQLVFFLQGTAGSGRTTIAETLMRVMGTYSEHARRDLVVATKNDRIRADLGTSVNKHMVVVDELGPSDIIATGLLRYITNDPIKVEVKHRNPYTARNNMTPWIITNFENRLDSQDGAVLRRLVVLRFYRPAPAVYNTRLVDEFEKDEGQGIMQWCIDGMADAMEHGIRALIPETVSRDTNELLRSQDRMTPYLEECLKKSTDGGTYPLSEILRDVRIFYDARGEVPPCSTTKALGSMLRERRYDVHESHGTSKVFGVIRIVPTNGVRHYTPEEMRHVIHETIQLEREVSTRQLMLMMPGVDNKSVCEILDEMKRRGEIMALGEKTWCLVTTM